jgi:metal-responsive CopG/Arc/MetJ family transcriptional regulator
MAREKSAHISARLDPKTQTALDVIIERDKYHSRSQAIQCLIKERYYALHRMDHNKK